MRIAGIILARTDSARLPEKCFRSLGGKMLVEWPILALKEAGVTPILATSVRAIDQPLIDVARRHDIQFFCGDLHDVAQRFVDCIDKFKLTHAIRINGDSPFLNIPLLKESISYLSKSDYELVSNLVSRSYPYGLSVEIINTKSYKKSLSLFDENQREHITQFFYENIDDFNIKELPVLIDDFQCLSMVVDDEKDLNYLNEFVSFTDISSINAVDVKTLIEEFLKFKKNKQ